MFTSHSPSGELWPDMPIIGTAGHVDHGKSTLVEALTGRDPDRWAEEKERGLTIDLGFAWTKINGIDVGFVDVPGHERFIKNMLAGIGTVDCALLVVAADSGWMPQTEEHAAILDLLDTTIGVIALTRVDLVDEDTIELATLEIMEEIEGSTLEGWPIVPVCAITGHGMENLVHHLGRALDLVGEPAAGPLRMWIDRSFTVSGAGVVVTGTIARGSIAVGDDIEILPIGVSDRVRGLHHHDQETEFSIAGSRTAINLQGAELTQVPRGSLICTPGSIGVSNTILARIDAARRFNDIPPRGAFHVHVGTAHSPATIRRLHGSNVFLIRTASPLPVAMGDRFILRESGRQAVVGGGQILDPHPPPRISLEEIEILRLSLGGSSSSMADALLTVRGVSNANDLFEATGGGVPTTSLRAGESLLSERAVHDVVVQSIRIVSEYHEQHPLRPGIPKPELASQIGVTLDVVDAAIDHSDDISQSGGAVRLSEFTDTLSQIQESEWTSARSELEKSFDVPRMSSIQLNDELLRALVRRGDLVQVAPDLVFTRQQVANIHDRISDLPDGFTVGQFKEFFEMTRRQAVPTLEWLDKTGWTRRVGDQRTVRQRR